MQADAGSSPLQPSEMLQLQFPVALARGGEEFVADGERYMLHSMVLHADPKPDDTSGGSLAKLADALVFSHSGNPCDQVGVNSPGVYAQDTSGSSSLLTAAFPSIFVAMRAVPFR